MSGAGAQFGWICQFYYKGQIKGLCKQIDIQGIVIFLGIQDTIENRDFKTYKSEIFVFSKILKCQKFLKNVA